jgi:Uncharacterized membrane protein
MSATQPIEPSSPHDLATSPFIRRAVVERATVREILMGAQDNLTNVLAVMLGVSIGSGRADLVALAGMSAAVAESVSMGGVLYSSTRAERALETHAGTTPAQTRSTLAPVQSGVVTFAAAFLAGLIPLAPFVVLPLTVAVPVSIGVSIGALFLLGAAIGRISGAMWWRDGFRLVLVAGLAAVAAAAIGTAFRIQ